MYSIMIELERGTTEIWDIYLNMKNTDDTQKSLYKSWYRVRPKYFLDFEKLLNTAISVIERKGETACLSCDSGNHTDSFLLILN